MIALLASAASAGCDPWAAAALADWDGEARDALFAEDLPRFGAVWERLAADLPCVEGPVDPETWASFLVGLAVYEYAMGLEWVEPLTTAVRAWPDVPRDIGAPAVRSYGVARAPRPLGPLPVWDRFWLDGRPIDEVPSLQGLHLVQRERGGAFETRLLRDAPFPADWTAEAPSTIAVPAPSPDGSGWAVGAIGLGYGARAQSARNPDPHLPEGGAASPVVGLTSLGAWSAPPSAVRLGWEASGSIQVGEVPAADVYGLVGVGAGPAVLYAGGGLTTGVVAVDDDERLVVLPQPHVGALVGAGPLSVAASGGWTLAAWHAGALASARPGQRAGVALLAGFLAHRSRFDEEGGDLSVAHLRWTATLGLGASLGRPD